MVCKYQKDVLSPYDQRLSKFDVGTIHQMTRATRRTWIHHLDATKAAYTKELKQKATGQNVITRYLVPIKVLNDDDQREDTGD